MIAIISQARVNSSRLPNKIFLKAGGKPFLWYHIERVKKTGLPVIIATTNDGSETPIIDFCKENKIPFFCGDEQNVLKRFYDCAVAFKITTVIRVTSDCPLIDPELINKGIKEFEKLPSSTYYSNALQRTYPRGMDYEIFSFDLLKDAYENATDLSDQEHVTPYIWKNKSGNVILRHDLNDADDSNFRITLDTEEDRMLLTKIIEEHSAFDMNCKNIVRVLRKNPDLAAINRHIEQKKV